MVERRITQQQLLGTVLLVAVAVGALGYGLGRFVTPPEQVTSTTTATSTTTQVSTSTVTVTERLTTISTVSRELPQTFPPPANSTAVIRSFYLFDGRVLATLSIDKPTYSLGETVHIKATFTKVSPSYDDLTLDTSYSAIRMMNSSEIDVWTYPELLYVGGIGPAIPYHYHLPPGETITIDHMTREWNMTGLHEGYNNGWNAFYDNHPVPPGQYTLYWHASFHSISDDKYNEINEEINFTITATKK
jgi:hypothetical protein